MVRKCIISAAFLCAVIMSAVSCKKDPHGDAADLVVYGDIFTSESDGVVQAFAVKGGKYVYVGTQAEAEKYIGAKTKVIRQPKGGMVMAGCTESHGHYISSEFYSRGKFVIRFNSGDTKETILDKVTEMAAKKPTYVYGFGFEYLKLRDNLPTRTDLDKIIDNVPVFFNDSEGHKGIANSLCIKNSGILTDEGKVKDDFLYKDYVQVDPMTGYPTGLLLEQASTYVRSRACVPDDEYDVWEDCTKASQIKLNSMGYTAAFDGWANKFGMKAYQAAHSLDVSGNLTINLAMAFEIENLGSSEVENQINEAIAAKQYSGKHLHANLIKLFEDGTPETGTGYMLKPNSEDERGHGIWSAEQLEDITNKANANGLAMHIHAMGDAAVQDVVGAYEKAYNAGSRIRNQIVHLRNVASEDYDRMAKCDMVAACGVLWHRFDMSEIPGGDIFVNHEYKEHGYPYQSFLDHGVHTTISTDAPATCGAPADPFGIMEIAVTATQTFGEVNYPTAWDEGECVRNRADFLRSLTIEGAYQMCTEKERGSIAVGKFADFIVISQNVLSCPAKDLHKTEVLATYFEGRNVFGE